MKKTMVIVLSVLALLIVIVLGVAISKKVLPIGFGMHKAISNSGGIALNGYDVTSYFKGNLQKGNAEYSIEEPGAQWYFASKENLNEFKMNPGKFMPQYGGYCTKAVSVGFAVPPDPTFYSIYEDKLYIFSDDRVKSDFLTNPTKMIASCSKKWK